jgi:hypothetical protein
VRMLKTLANKAAGEKEPQAYPLGYVEDCFEPRTKLAGVFSIRYLFGDRDELPDPRSETPRVPALNEHESWPSEPADKSFTRSEAGNPAGGGFFDVVGGCRRPRNQVAIVDDVFLIGLQLDLVNGPETIQNKRPLPADIQNEETFSTQQPTAQALHFIFDHDPLCACKEPVFLHHIIVHTIEFQNDNFPRYRWGQQCFAGASTCAQGLKKEFLPGEEFS